ncbi:hypothetical protein [Paracoccus sp. (in: a-proteobacteria)]|uniref:hypothetical protein n=1 Tax=Paracoccus sp. TaxID=267 RepID=UPI00396C43BA
MNKHVAPPEFAMSFTQEAVQLERRDGLAWQPLGQARFAGGDLAGVLNALRDKAGGQTGELDTVLVIPDDQILYTTLTVPFGADTATTIARALESVTPYRAEDLVFDWCPSANGEIETLRVAAVARRTLDEAEDFARAQGFRPSGFQARPDDGRFDGQPDFGTSRLVQEEYNRRPFSGPDLMQARITAPMIEAAPEAVRPAAAKAVAVPTVISRVTPHVVPAAAGTMPAAAASEQATAGEDAPAATDQSPRTGTAVIRHGQAAPLAATRLSARAEAVRNRAAAARAHPADDPDDDDAGTTGLAGRLGQLDPARLPVLIGILALGLVLAFLFLGNPSGPGEAPVTAQNPETLAPVPEPEAQQTAAIKAEPVQNVAPQVSQQTAPAAVTPTPDVSAPNPATSTEPVPAEQAPVAAAEAPTDADDALTRALAEAIAAPEPAATQPQPVSDEQVAPAQLIATASQTAASAAGIDTATVAEQAPVPAPATPTETAPAEAAAPRLAEPAAPPPAAPRAAQPSAAASAPPPAPAANAAPAPASPAVRPVRPPRATPAAAAAPAAPDSRPVVPGNPAPANRAALPQPAAVPASRPPARPAARPVAATAPAPAAPVAAAPAASAPAAAAPAATRPQAAQRPPSPNRSAPATAPATATPAPAPAPVPAATAGSNRPPQRPANLSLLEEGSLSEASLPHVLTQGEKALIRQQLRDLRTAQAGAAGLTEAERGLVFQIADARPTRKPVAVRAPSQKAVTSAIGSARPEARGTTSERPAATTAAPVEGRMARSARPSARPGSRPAAPAGRGSLSAGAVERAIASAIENSPAAPGAVPLTALTSSALPPRRVAGAASTVAAAAGASANAMIASAAPVAAAISPSAADLRAAAEAQASAAAQAAQDEQRRQDAELQAQAEARARSQAAADARAEAQARAQAEARARAQAEAEARTAAARNQRYQPPEIDQEPEVVAAVPQNAVGNAAASATVKDGIQLKSTQIIGTIGAGQASRALVRLSNGRVLTLRIGDKINGGTISAIGDSRITYQKAGRAHALGVLNGQ